MSDRIGCCIAGCRRTFKKSADDPADGEIMCGRHWRMSDEILRRRHKQLRRRFRWFDRRWKTRRNAIEKSPRLHKFDDAWRRTWGAENSMWLRIKEDVTIKAAFGVEDAPRRRTTVAA
jgi:hypothetical protein